MALRSKNLNLRRSGLSLLEVVLALAILGASLAVISQLVNMGYRSAEATKYYSEAQILCDAKMAEVACCALPLESTGQTAIEENPIWVYQVDVQNAELDGLKLVIVTVSQKDDRSRYPVSFSLTRLMADPNYEPPPPPPAE